MTFAVYEMLIAEMIAIADRRPAFNMTAGGDGTRGAKRTPAQIERIRAAAKKRGAHPGLLVAAVKANTGRKQSAETKAKIGAANRGQKRTPEQRERCRVAALLRRKKAPACAD